MSIYVPAHDLAFFPVPKTACTSFKRMLFEVENGFPLENFRANGRLYHVHNAAYPTQPVAAWDVRMRAAKHRLLIVRDPLKRFLSAYANRVVFHKELSEQKAGHMLRKKRLTADPDLGEFVDRLEKYLQVSSVVHHHIQPLVDFSGKDPSFFTRVFRFDQITECADLIREISQTNYELPHRQSGGPKLSADLLTEKQKAKVEKFYKYDYKHFGNYF